MLQGHLANCHCLLQLVVLHDGLKIKWGNGRGSWGLGERLMMGLLKEMLFERNLF